MTDHPPLGMVDVYAATIPGVKFAPADAMQKLDAEHAKGDAEG